MITYSVTHPQMSHPLEMDSAVPRQPRAVAAWASMYILRHFDEVLDLDEFTVKEVVTD